MKVLKQRLKKILTFQVLSTKLSNFSIYFNILNTLNVPISTLLPKIIFLKNFQILHTKNFLYPIYACSLNNLNALIEMLLKISTTINKSIFICNVKVNNKNFNSLLIFLSYYKNSIFYKFYFLNHISILSIFLKKTLKNIKL